MEEDLQLRFRGLDWVEQCKNRESIVGGSGGIGSWLSLFLSRAGNKLLLVDFDRVEIHNLGGQLFRKDQVGAYKVMSVRNICEFYGQNKYVEMSTRKITEYNDMRYERFNDFFCAFDNMEARKNLFKHFLNEAPSDCSIFIDGRLEAEQLQVFAIRRDDEDRIAEYQEKHLFLDSSIEDVACTIKQTSHIASMIASVMSSVYFNHLSNIKNGVEIREVPFFTEFSSPMMNMTSRVAEPLNTEEDGE